jgi:serine/threonine-protein kinase
MPPDDIARSPVSQRGTRCQQTPYHAVVSGDGLVETTDLVPPAIAVPEVEVGARLGDRYRLIARLGRGGGGTVWRVFDEKVGEELALKLIEGGTDLERWRREVALARRISHGNVCRVYDLGEAGGLRWVTMERIEGESLRALLQRRAGIATEPLMRQLVDAVAAIHAAGVVHRDLKPENVVVDGSGRAVIVDFGLARRPVVAEARVDAAAAPADRAVTGHGTVLGTPRYMAPEQAAGEVADARADVYALGLVLEEIALGDDAAAAPTEPAGVPAPRAAVPRTGLARPWGPVIARCTLPAAAERFPDAVAVRDALVAPRRMRWRLAIAGGLVAAVAAALLLATAGDRAPRIGPVVQRRLTATAGATRPTSIAVSRDGTLLAYTVGQAVLLRPIDGGGDTAATMPLTGGGLPLARQVEAAGFLDDGRVVAQILDRDHDWALWALGSGLPRVLVQRAERMVVAVSPRADRLAVATSGGGLVAVEPGGAERTLIAARPGEQLGGLAWSPDGARVAFVRRAIDGSATLETVAVARPADRRVIARARLADPVDQMTAWLDDDRVAYVANEPAGGAALIAVSDGAAPEALVRWPQEHVAQLAAGHGRLVVLRGTAERTVAIAGVDRRGYFLNLERAVPEHAHAEQLVGWTAEGRLVHAADGEVVVRPADEPATPLAAGSPDTVVGGRVIYHRGTAIRAVNVAGGGDRALAELAAAPSGDLVRCAGDRAPPCVIAELDRQAVRYRRFDPETGALGDEVYRAALGQRFARAMAVSPDGATLAVVDGSSTVTLVALGGGRVDGEALPHGAAAVEVSWSCDGASLLVSVLDGGEDRASVIRLWPRGARQLLLHSDQVRYGRVHETLVDRAVAIETREVAFDAWLIDGL